MKDFSFTFLELPKFKKEVADLKNMIDKWSYFFKHAEETSEKELERLIGRDKIMKRAFLELDRFSWNDEELFSYDQAEKYQNTYYASLAQKFDEGKLEGLLEGEMKGKIAIVQKMLSRGKPVQEIAEDLGMSQEEVEFIRDEKK